MRCAINLPAQKISYTQRLCALLIIGCVWVTSNAQAAAPAYEQPAYDQRIELFGKSWGLLKYFHSEIAACRVDWDAVFIDLYPQIGGTGTTAEFNDLLHKLIDEAGPNTQRGPLPDDPEPHLQQAVDYSWLNSEFIAEATRLRLQAVLDAFRPGDHCLVGTGPAGEPVFDADQGYFDTAGVYPAEAYRMLAVFRFWHAINYFFPYKHLLSQPWEQSLRAFIPRVSAAANAREYHLAMKAFTARIEDSHAFFSSSDYFEYLGSFEAYTPFHARFVEGKTVVVRALAGTGLQPGDVIIRFNGQPIQSVRNTYRSFLHGSNPIVLEREVTETLLWGRDGSRVALTLERNGEEFSLAVTRGLQNRGRVIGSGGPVWRTENLGACTMGYVDMGRLTTSQLDSMMTALRPTDGIIFDLRNYPNGTLWPLVSNYLFAAPIHIASFAAPNTRHPGRFTWFENTIGRGTSAPYQGRLLILFNEDTQSQAEFTVMGLEQHPNAVKIGSQTAAADGNITSVKLPDGITAYFTGLGTYYPDGTGTQRVGIVPDLSVHPSIAGIRQGRDEVLEAAMNCDALNPEWPLLPTPDPGMYFDPARSGHGLVFGRAGRKYIAINYSYDDAGTAEWQFAVGEVDGGVFQLDELSQVTRDAVTRAVQVTPVSDAALLADFQRGPYSIDCASSTPGLKRDAARFQWQFGPDSGVWCIERLVFSTDPPTTDFSGLWSAGSADSGWGISVDTQGDILLAVMAYHDAQGQAVWAVGVGELSSDGVAELTMQQLTGYCRTCPVADRVATNVGRMRLELREPSQAFVPGNQASFDLTPHGDDSYHWRRDAVPVKLLTEPAR